MKQLTIFTPTYNRANTLTRLYNSLLNQDTNMFKWLVVDDGSTDNTKQLVEGWIAEGKLEIRYIYEKNSGKTSAHNLGVRECNTELFLCCDSDDWMAENSIKPALDFWNSNQKELSGMVGPKLIHQKELSGMVGPRDTTNKNYDSLSTLPKNIKRGTLYGLYNKGYVGETALFFRTSIIKKYPFPKIEGEKFIPEEYIYRRLDEKYEMLVYPHYCMDCEYQPDGYSNNIRKLKLNNPKGFLLNDLEKLKKKFTLKQAIMVLGLEEYIGLPYKLSSLPHPFMMFLLIPAGKILAVKYKHFMNKN